MIPARRLARAAALAAALLVACGAPERRLEEAFTLRHEGDPSAALEAAKALLADLGDGPLAAAETAVRSRALRLAGDLASLELGEPAAALGYYRRLVTLDPAGPEAPAARMRLGALYRDRFDDPLAAIAQHAAVAASAAPEAAACQLEVVRGYLALRRIDQARTEARLLRERWPSDPLADEAELLAGQALALAGREDEALAALQALVERPGARRDAVARALEAQAELHAQRHRFGRALALYAAARPHHPNPDGLRIHVEAVRARRARAAGAAGARVSLHDPNL